MSNGSLKIGLILSVLNEAEPKRDVAARILEVLPGTEVIVLQDGSTANTAGIAGSARTKLLSQPYRLVNGSPTKSRVRAARAEMLVLIDADSEHDPANVPRLQAGLQHEYVIR